MENKRVSIKELRTKIGELEAELRRLRWQKESDDKELGELRDMKLSRDRNLAFQDGQSRGSESAAEREIARLWHVLRSIVGDKTVLDGPVQRDENRFESRRPSPFDNFGR